METIFKPQLLRKIKVLRQDKSLTYGRMATALGICRNTYVDFESGFIDINLRVPEQIFLEAICKILDCQPEDLHTIQQPSNIGLRIIQFRVTASMTQQALADKINAMLGTDFKRNTISN